MQKRSVRNRKRSQRRAIYCPTHGCYLDSVSQKHTLYTESADVLRARGMNRFAALTLIATHTTISLTGEWLEAFWCDECEEARWYHVKKLGDRDYEVRRAPRELWLQATGVIHPDGNPSVGEFTRRQARAQVKVRDFGSVLG